MKPWQCQAALAVTQTAFCVGSVYLKSCLRKVDSSDGHVFHPIIYAFLREATAGPIMCAMAWFTSGAAPSRLFQSNPATRWSAFHMPAESDLVSQVLLTVLGPSIAVRCCDLHDVISMTV